MSTKGEGDCSQRVEGMTIGVTMLDLLLSLQQRIGKEDEQQTFLWLYFIPLGSYVLLAFIVRSGQARSHPRRCG